MKELLRIVERHVEKVLKKMPVHGFNHTLRVYKLVLRIANECNESADIEILSLAAMLHDIGRPLENKIGRHHALISAEMAEKLLSELNYPKDKIAKVREVILAHSYTLKRKAESIEAKILSDADKLDAIGAIGIARCFIEAGMRKRDIEETLKHFKEKLLKLKDLMYTDPARKIAIKRHAFMIHFLKRLQEEIEGKA